MKRTIELLKNKGIIDKLQKNFNEIKPPKGTSEECILECIDESICSECKRDENFEDEFFDAVWGDAIQNIRNELKVEFVEQKDFMPNALAGMLSSLFGNANVQVHVVRVEGGEKKGQGDK